MWKLVWFIWVWVWVKLFGTSSQLLALNRSNKFAPQYPYYVNCCKLPCHLFFFMHRIPIWFCSNPTLNKLIPHSHGLSLVESPFLPPCLTLEYQIKSGLDLFETCLLPRCGPEDLGGATSCQGDRRVMMGEWLSLFVSITIQKLGLVGRPASLRVVVVFYILQIELGQMYTLQGMNWLIYKNTWYISVVSSATRIR